MRFFRIVTPLLLVNLLALYGIVGGWLMRNSNGSWSVLGVVIGIPVLFFGVLFDIGFRELCKNQPGKLWLYEILFIVVGYFIFQNVIFR